MTVLGYNYNRNEYGTSGGPDSFRTTVDSVPTVRSRALTVIFLQNTVLLDKHRYATSVSAEFVIYACDIVL